MMQTTIDRLKAEDNYRELRDLQLRGKWIDFRGREYLNLSSNDYLSMSSSPLYRTFIERAAGEDAFLLSNPSSRLVTGNSTDYELLEEALSTLYGGCATLVLGSGYLVNCGVLPALTTKGDLILSDKLIHASLIDGMRLSEATWRRFPHNDMNHLERLLSRERASYRRVWVVCESIYSMDGDAAPLRDLVALKERYDLDLYLDEAHAFGVRGAQGRGLAEELGVEESFAIRVATLGKAAASQGAFVVCDSLTRSFLINKMRTLIFSTALPPISLRWGAEVVRSLPQMGAVREHLALLSARLSEVGLCGSHIIPWVAGSNSRAIAWSNRLREEGFWVTPIRTPTVPEGSARIRFSLQGALTLDEVDKLARLCSEIG